MKLCPACNKPLSGRSFGNEQDKYALSLKEAWDHGMRTALFEPTLTRKNHHDQMNKWCPYDDQSQPAHWCAWRGGLFHGMCWRHEAPEEVAAWLIANPRLKVYPVPVDSN